MGEMEPDHREAYGAEPSQFGELWVPEAALGVSGERAAVGAGWPVVVFFHGGWWKAKYDLGYARPMCAALRSAGVACWSVEYRRVGERGGGWPGTLQDAAAGMDHLLAMASGHGLDLGRVVAMGHSAGGHLAFWSAGRRHVPEGSEVYQPRPRVVLRGAVALAGAVDLRLVIEMATGEFAHDADEVRNLMGAGPEAVPARYAAGDPGELLPLAGQQVLIQGTEDDQIPAELPARWAAKARAMGSEVRVEMVAGVDHMGVAEPESRAWPVVLRQVRRVLGV